MIRCSFRRAAGPQPKRCCRTGQKSARKRIKLRDNWCRAAAVHADQRLFTLSDMMMGANMEA